MKLKYSLTALLVSCGAVHGANLLTSGDFIIAIGSTGSEFPGGEQPTAVIDGTTGTKYLNFGGVNSGFIVTPGSGSSIARSAVFRTGGDAPERDPSNVSIYGTNDPIGSVINGTGSKESWSLISSFDANLPNARLTTSAPIDFTNGTSYSSYRISFDSLKDNNAVSQLDEFQLFSEAGGAGGIGSSILGAADSIISFDTDVTASSNFPGGEAPGFAIDGNIGTKYLNFQGRGTGFIVTPVGGSSVISAFTLTTGNDAPGRDPNAYAIYGTNDAITSAENSTGSNESWTLIQAGTLNPPGGRGAAYDPEAIANGAAYTSYRFDVLGNGGDNLMQFAEIQFDGTFIPEPSSAMLAMLGLLPVFRRRR